MKLTISNKAIASGIVASTLFAGQQHQTAFLGNENVVDSSDIQAFDFQPVFTDDELEEEETSLGHMVSVPQEPEWNSEYQSRFEDLAEKLAFEDNLTSAEKAELNTLEMLRNITHPSRSYDEIVADQELHRKVNEAIKGLEMFVEYATRTFPSEAKTNRS